MRLAGQTGDTLAKAVAKPKYDRKEEIIYDSKRYRIYNNYLTAGLGFLGSDIRANAQRAAGIDYHFHIKRQYFQAGVLMSGDEFLGNNNLSAHICYGIREEKNTSNFTLFAGPGYFTGVEGTPGVTAASYYQGASAYFCFQAIFKFKYDVGLGIDVFSELSSKQKLGGIKFIIYFSSAYMGLKGNYNPHVRSENRR